MGCQGLLAVDLKILCSTLSGLMCHADSPCMKFLLNYLNAFLFGATGKTIRVDKDYLPGLRAPKSLPKPPIPYATSDVASANDINAMHKRFRETSGITLTQVVNERKGIDFK